MYSTSDLRLKEVVNVLDGRRLGPIADVELNLDEGRITALVLPGDGRFLGLFGKEHEIIVRWEEIRRVGEDVILVELPPSPPREKR